MGHGACDASVITRSMKSCEPRLHRRSNCTETEHNQLRTACADLIDTRASTAAEIPKEKGVDLCIDYKENAVPKERKSAQQPSPCMDFADVPDARPGSPPAKAHQLVDLK